MKKTKKKATVRKRRVAPTRPRPAADLSLQSLHFKPVTDQPCQRCYGMAKQGTLPWECIMPLPQGAYASQARDGSGPCCDDCASADAMVPRLVPDFHMARVATANERSDDLRAPEGLSQHMGLFKMHFMQPLQGTQAIKIPVHFAWLKQAVPEFDVWNRRSEEDEEEL